MIEVNTTENSSTVVTCCSLVYSKTCACMAMGVCVRLWHASIALRAINEIEV